MDSEVVTPSTPIPAAKNTILVVVAAILIAVVIFQSYELQELKGYTRGRLESQTVKAASGSSQTAVPTASVRPAASALPSQVGGC